MNGNMQIKQRWWRKILAKRERATQVVTEGQSKKEKREGRKKTNKWFSKYWKSSKIKMYYIQYYKRYKIKSYE